MDVFAQEEWPEWTSKRSELLIDGLTVTQVFSNVHIQLETLRKRRFATKSGILFEDELTNLANKILKLGGSGGDKIPGIEQKLKVLERRIEGLDDTVSDKSDIQKLEIKINGRIDGLERRLVSVEAALTQVGLGKGLGADMSIESRLELLEKNMEDMLVKVPSFEENLLGLNTQFDLISKQLEILPKKVSELSDDCSINQYRIDGLEKLLAELQGGHDRLKVILDNSTDDCLRRVKKELQLFDDIKADRSELNRKIDNSQLMLKADISEVSLLNDLSNQLDKRIDANKGEMTEAMKVMRSNYDKRLEALLQWILKQLRRLGGGKKGETGTDIGKVKCLVCDQVVSQLQETEIVFGGPALPSSLKMLSHNRPMPFENDADQRRAQTSNSNPQQPWSRHPNKSGSPSNNQRNQQGSPTNPNIRLSTQNLETLGVDRDRGYEHGQRERPRSATLHRMGQNIGNGIGNGQQPMRDRSLSFSAMGGDGVYNPYEQNIDAYENNNNNNINNANIISNLVNGSPGEVKLSLFKELEL